MNIKLPEYVETILEKIEEAGFEAYVVGGAVRDLLLGKISDDWDFTTNASPEEIMSVFPDGFYDNKFGTVGYSHESSPNPYEITTFRTEHGYSDNRRPDKVVWGKSLEEDLERRDFTINSIALQKLESSGKYRLIDPFNGQKDLEKKLIRAVGDPQLRFNEDALRMMRAIRIASQIGFNIEGKTIDAIKQNATLINKIAKERIKDELFKILSSPTPSEGVALLKESGLLIEILPELEKCFGVEQKSPQRHHKYDVGTHLLYSLKFCSSINPVVRFACLIHDIGKPQTYKVLPNGVVTFYNHEMVGTKITSNIADRLRLSKKEKEKLVTLVRWHQFSVGEMQTDTAIRRFIKNVGLENVEDMLILRTADRLGSGASETSWRTEDFKKRIIEVQKEPFSIKDLKINGLDVMRELNISSGPRVGEILGKLFESVENKKIKNEKKSLLKELKLFS